MNHHVLLLLVVVLHRLPTLLSFACLLPVFGRVHLIISLAVTLLIVIFTFFVTTTALGLQIFAAGIRCLIFFFGFLILRDRAVVDAGHGFVINFRLRSFVNNSLRLLFLVCSICPFVIFRSINLWLLRGILGWR